MTVIGSSYAFKNCSLLVDTIRQFESSGMQKTIEIEGSLKQFKTVVQLTMVENWCKFLKQLKQSKPFGSS